MDTRTIRECDLSVILYAFETNLTCSWEPPTSFQGSADEVIEDFWKSVNVNGRDTSDPSQFKQGEEVLAGASP